MKLRIPRRISLRVFLVGSVLSGLILSFAIPEIQRMFLIAKIEKLGGVVGYDQNIQADLKSKKVARISNLPSNDKLPASELRVFPHLREIGLGTVTSDLGIQGELIVDFDTYENSWIRDDK